jgi:hypothetical protein
MSSFLNPDGRLATCNVPAPPGRRPGAIPTFEVDVPVPETGSSTDLIELTAVGNYE